MTPRSLSSRRTGLRLIVPIILALSAAGPALAGSGYVSAAELARAHGLEYKDMSAGPLRAAKLIGNGREVFLVAGVQTVTVNGASAALAMPVRWNGNALEVPEDAVGIILGAAPLPATPAEAVEAAPGPPVSAPRGAVVVVDPGHGGKDPGTRGETGLEEKVLTLEVGLAAGAFLEEHGVKVIYTRRSDVFVPLEDRADIANRADPNLFLSIHFNSDARRDRRGAMILYPAANAIGDHPGIMGRAEEAATSSDDDARAYRADIPRFFGAGGPVGRTAMLALLGTEFADYRERSIEAAHCLQEALAPVTGLVEHDDGVIEDFRSIHVLRETHCPAILCEGDFLSNAVSERKLWTHGYRSAIAQAIGRGVLAFLAESSCERQQASRSERVAP